MKKLKLDLNDLKVESFETVVRNNVQKGTVVGNKPTVYGERSCDAACPYTENFEYTCGTCIETCPLPC